MRNQIIPTNPNLASPEFIPLPVRGRDPLFGLSRSTYYKLEVAKYIRLVRLRQPGKLRGRVLIDCSSVRNYLSRINKQQNDLVAEGTEASGKLASGGVE